jgi:hypothetical protein
MKFGSKALKDKVHQQAEQEKSEQKDSIHSPKKRAFDSLSTTIRWHQE